MKPTSAKGEIMSKLRDGLTKSTAQPYQNIDTRKQLFQTSSEVAEVRFAEQFTALDGNFVFCQDEQELFDNIVTLSERQAWRHLFAWEKEIQDFFISNQFKKVRIGRGLDKADASITSCEALIARSGSILISSSQTNGRGLSIFPPVHLVIAQTAQIVPDLSDALAWMKEKYEKRYPSMVSLISGPSRTADIEKTLVLGAHGPKEVYVFLLDK